MNRDEKLEAYSRVDFAELKALAKSGRLEGPCYLFVLKYDVRTWDSGHMAKVVPDPEGQGLSPCVNWCCTNVELGNTVDVMEEGQEVNVTEGVLDKWELYLGLAEKPQAKEWEEFVQSCR